MPQTTPTRVTLTLPANPMAAITGREPQTTFWEDFSIADKFGLDAVLDTYHRAFTEWKTDVEYLGELSLVLNWKIWQHHEAGQMALARLYDSLWRQADNWANENLAGEDAHRYFELTD